MYMMECLDLSTGCTATPFSFSEFQSIAKLIFSKILGKYESHGLWYRIERQKVQRFFKSNRLESAMKVSIDIILSGVHYKKAYLYFRYDMISYKNIYMDAVNQLCKVFTEMCLSMEEIYNIHFNST